MLIHQGTRGGRAGLLVRVLGEVSPKVNEQSTPKVSQCSGSGYTGYSGVGVVGPCGGLLSALDSVAAAPDLPNGDVLLG